jgi:hypothetical protein
MERYRTTIIMAAILGVLVVAAMLLSGNNKDSSTTGTTPAPVVTYLWQEEPQVLGIDVMSGTARISLRRDVSSTLWMITEPEKFPAETFQVDNTASLLQKLEAAKVTTGTSDLAQYGLDKTGMMVTVTFSSTTPLTHTLQVGDANVGATSWYVKQPSSPDVWLVKSTVIGALQNWLTTPPKEPPTPTPFPTAPPTPTATATVIATPAGPIGPQSSSSPSPVVQSSPVGHCLEPTDSRCHWVRGRQRDDARVRHGNFLPDPVVTRK